MKLINSVMFLIALISIWIIPTYAYILLIFSLLMSLAFSTYTIFQKHKGIENARTKILKEVGVMVITLIIIIIIIILFFGGVAAMLANYQVGVRRGEVAGIMSAIGASFGVGYLVRKRMRAIL